MLPGNVHEKALLWSAFLLSGLCLLFPSFVQAACPVPDSLQPVRVTKVFDGDTVKVADGRSIRLVGINTPEMNYKSGAPEPYARDALAYVRTHAERITGMVPGAQRQDRYKRTLAHLYFQNGNNVEEQLLRKGLAVAISIPPNLTLRRCLWSAERYARDRRLGIWSRADSVLAVAELPSDAAGFHVLSGRITRVQLSGKRWSLWMGGQVELKIAARVRSDFKKKDLQALVGQTVEVRGWLINPGARSKGKSSAYRFMSISHPDHIRPTHR